MKTRVRTEKLNLRAAPSLSAPIVTVLKKGHDVDITGVPRANGFIAVRVEHNGQAIDGHVWSAFVESLPASAAATPHAVHLKPPIAIRRREDTGHAYPLHEPDPPGRGDTIDAADLLALVRWLRVEHDEHIRYKPKGATTYCNVYAYDYCYLAGVYLPRVWWLESSLKAFERGERVHPEYAKTVGELSANMLFHWLESWSTQYGWERVESLDELQDAANAGQVSVICGRHNEDAKSGHISIVAPESDQLRAVRKENKVTLPAQSQAGATLLEYGNGTDWWAGKQFKEIGFWRHA